VMCDKNHVGGDFIVPGKLPENLITESGQWFQASYKPRWPQILEWDEQVRSFFLEPVRILSGSSTALQEREELQVIFWSWSNRASLAPLIWAERS
jgi:hypothetical protein